MASTLPVVQSPAPARFGQTLRRDNWWAQPIFSAATLLGAGLYATWAVLFGVHNYAPPYLSPFYSPCLGASCPDEFRLASLPTFGLSPAILIMMVVFGFRTTCYYYRKTYYRSLFFDPPACAVGEPWGKGYRGETFFPLILQNFHRYFLYLALVVIAFLWYDTAKAFSFGGRFGVGLGSLILVVNAVLISGYVLGCHSFRHLVGGSQDCTNCSRFGQARHSAWKKSTWFNVFHGNWAWASLVFVCLADIYVRLCSMGVIHDPHFVF
ncbi:MAG TPA: hypothetical protein VFJ16_03970 [Longimicrobium sp.]|nr:hypothetical protein [Longimicrobium sp.]